MGRAQRQVLPLTLCLGALITAVPAVLEPSFYRETCPTLERDVAARVKGAIRADPSLAAKLLRLHFHDCFVQGCDASILLDRSDGARAEKDAEINLTVDGYDLIDDLKALAEGSCPNTVSCADLTALAARDAVKVAGGPTIPLRTGRRDGFGSMNPDATTLPTLIGGVLALRRTFRRVGLDTTDLVALSGAHTLGVGTCLNVQERMPPFDPDGLLESKFLRNMTKACFRRGVLRETRKIPLDFKTPLKFDNQYFKNLQEGKGRFITDSLLNIDDRTKRLVTRFANSQKNFFDQFKKSFIRMSEIKVLTGDEGEIRSDCRITNNYYY